MKNKILCFLDEYIHLKKNFSHLVLLICFLLVSAISFSASAENSTVYQQNRRTVTGIVTDNFGEPLIGVTVREQGTSNGTITNADGGYVISVGSGAILTFNYVGYKPVAQNVTSDIVNAVLAEDVETLDDLVVVGYGVQKKSDVTGAMVSVGQKELKAMPVQNALQAMQGKTAGVDITSNERPGEIGSIRIRGERSLNATNSPLYVVDGIPLHGTGIDNLNANDIESIDILKDASATAIYGSRGANGVILVTTKRGKSGSLNLTYDGSVSFERMYDRVEMMNSGEWIDYSRAARIKAGTYNGSSTISKENDLAVFGTDPYAWAQFEKGWVGGSWDGALVPTYDWTSHGLQTALTHEHTVSASGGTDKMQNYLSFGYLKQDGTQPGQQYQRYTAKTSVDITPLEWIKLGTSINASWGDQEYGYNFRKSVTGASNLYFALQGMLPWTVPYTADGDYIRNPGGDVNIINPILESDLCRNQRQNLRLFGSLYSDFNIGSLISGLEGLRYRIQFGPDFRIGRTGVADPANSINGDGNNIAQYNIDIRRSWTFDNLIYYDKVINEHSLGLTLLQSASAYHTEGSNMRSFVNSAQELWFNLGSKSDIRSYGSFLTQTQLQSYMIRMNYGFADKYLLTASGRWDGASQLAPGHKWDFFPSLALGWRLDQENFMKNTSWLDQLKLRFGVGTTGNSAISAYATKGSVSPNYYHFGEATLSGVVASDPSAATPVVMANSSLGWEKTTQYNFGVDFSFLRGRVFGNIDLYKSFTNDLLMTKSLPALTGYLRTWANIGKTENQGIDITLNTLNISTRDFKWNTTLTFSADRSKIVELADGKTEDTSNGWFVGESIGSLYGYVYDGIWKTSEKDEAAKYGREPGKN